MKVTEKTIQRLELNQVDKVDFNWCYRNDDYGVELTFHDSDEDTVTLFLPTGTADFISQKILNREY